MEYVIKAAELALDWEIDAMATAPINKEAINFGGYRYSGHTELLSELSDTKNFTMMLMVGDLRVIHITTHVPLRDVADLIVRRRVLTTINLAHEAARSLGIEEPRIGVAGLNPHSGRTACL